MVSQFLSEGHIGKLPPQPWLVAPETKAIIAALTSEGAEVRFVGGCVRDSLLKNILRNEKQNFTLEIQDIDIATPASPKTVTRLLQKAGIKIYHTGIKHGTVSALIKDSKFEITTLRRDAETDGRHARVVFTNDWIIDAKRRDFTFNALSITPEGDIYDFFNGISDLSNGVVRFIGLADDRITEDVLRLLRFFRFFGLYGRLPVDTNALDACRTHSNKLTSLSGERIRNEMFKIMLTPKPGEVFKLMFSANVFNYILPEAKHIKRLCMIEWLETSVSKTVKIEPDALRRLAALIDTDTEGAKKMSKRWRLSNRESLRLISMVAPELTITPNIETVDLNFALYRLGTEMLCDFTLLAWADELAKTPQITKYRSKGWFDTLETCENWKAVKFPLNGNDAINLGIKEGPHISKLLNSVERWWGKSGFIAGRKACLLMLATMADKD